ncbi:DUF4974 domain-containing protein [Mucilaginibacter mali]|uniref:DUF4974 domain-containing protein n=1 Tax=Mucilaginibacter mali TaxID=2740462 RepID=A0A7D4Q662_9SPHI|nr:FecR family protein [Mucilaginibacter mali]QKJ29011.1 DUF4974 domain-containing protein [Mucilaginibacter mali]
MSKKEARDLIHKFKNKQATPEEEEKLRYWLHYLNEDKPTDLTGEELDRAEDDIWDKLQFAEAHRRSIIRPWMAAAAAVLVMFSVAGYFYMGRNDNVPAKSQIATVKAIVPGGNNAVLTLAGGKKIILNNAAEGDLVKQSGITIRKTSAGQIVYDVSGGDNTDTEAPITYNTIETPIGGQYQVKLADGSMVWLNAATKLRFPTRFVGTERRVELSGEGYFEVAHNKDMPFKVQSSRQEVTVLGTHFDISTYDDEPEVRTVLLQGSVRVSLLNKDTKPALLKPGQQAMLAANGINVSTADTTVAVAWKNGNFRFDDEKLESVMRKVARWYNVTVVFDNEKLKTETFNGVIQRFAKVSDLLKMLEAVGKVKFKVEGNRIHVMKKIN